MNFKNIHIGSLIQQKVKECDIDSSRICIFFKCNEKDIRKMYESESIETKVLVGWSKLLNYDFFRIYTQHLILFSPPRTNAEDKTKQTKSELPSFRKNIYTKEIIDFILEKISSEKMTITEVIQTYKIPKTTLYKWINKYTIQTQ